MQTVSDSKWKPNSTVIINIGNQIIHPRYPFVLIYKRLILR